MKNKFIKKLSFSLSMLAFFAGIILFFCAFTPVVPRGVTVNGESVGGMTKIEAAAYLRTKTENFLISKKLEVTGGTRKYTFTYPEIFYRDNLYEILKNATRGGNYTAKTTFYLCGLDEIVEGISQNESLPQKEPSATFTAANPPFEYDAGYDGKAVDKKALKAELLNSLKGGFENVNLKFTALPRKKNMQEVKENTVLLSSFTTFYDGENLNRSSNIRLAAARLNGKILNGGQTLSFNKVVGARVKERGFLPAKIIENGEFTTGYGGGVCQVSTTLYNAALLSGLKIEEYHPHSLAVGYVEPSRDAMVSGSSIDLKIKNPNSTPVYIRAVTGKNSVAFYIYGKSDGATYSISSEITGEIPATETITDDPIKAREGKDGIKSTGYLLINRGGYVKKVTLRRDKYLPLKRVVYNLPDPQP